MHLHDPAMIVFVALYDLAVIAALGLLAFSCVTDFLTMTIPNWISVAILAAFGVAFGVAALVHIPAFYGWKMHGAALGLMFVVTFIMFVCRVWGAGDSKLASAVALWVGLKGFMTFLVVMSFAGVGLVALYYVFRKSKADYTALGEQSWPMRVRAGEKTIPYGIAIAFGAIWTFFELGYLDLCNLVQGLL
ncbi:MAG: type leader peptidase family protein [Micavibrio sp.]|nr:type leader peptidase family protein [Micavibrio sp.]